MPWGTIELEPEVEDWLLSLTDDDFGQVERYIDLLAELTPAGDRDDAHLILAALVGGLLLARAVDDRALSDEILDRVANALHRALG